MALGDWLARRAGKVERKPASEPHGHRNYALVVASFAAFGAYVLVLPGLGFRVATFLYVAGAAALLTRPRGAKSWLKLVALALLTAAITYVVFERYLQVLLPRGRWTGF